MLTCLIIPISKWENISCSVKYNFIYALFSLRYSPIYHVYWAGLLQMLNKSNQHVFAAEWNVIAGPVKWSWVGAAVCAHMHVTRVAIASH